MNLKTKIISRFEKWSSEIRPVFGQRRALVVDDCEDIAASLSAVLEIKGFDACPALNGAQALTLFQEWQPHIVILDISLPDIHGIEIGRRMRALPWREAAVVAHTALDASEIREEGISAGFDAFLGKPVSPASLAAVIDALCPDALEWARERRRARSGTGYSTKAAG